MSKTTSGTDDDYPLAGTDGRSLACCISGYTSTHDGSSFFVLDSLWYPGGVAAICGDILLERPRPRAREALMVSVWT